jgi:hypothetical protein
VSPDNLVSVSARIMPATVARLDRIAAALTERRPGEVVKRSDALRVVIERGLAPTETELGITAAPSPAPSAKPAKKGGKAPRKA